MKISCKQYGTLFLSLLAAQAVSGQGSQITSHRSEPHYFTPSLGRGYSITTGKFYDDCLVDTIESQNKYDFEIILSEMANSIFLTDLSQFVSYPWLEETREVMRTRASLTLGVITYSHAVVLIAKLDKYASAVDDLKASLSPGALTLLQSDITAFVRSCGPNYVRSIRRTSELSVMFSYVSSSSLVSSDFNQEMIQEITNPLQGSGRASEQFSADRYSTSINFRGIGLGVSGDASSSFLVNSISKLRNVLKFAFHSMKNDGTGVPDSIEVVPWSQNNHFLFSGATLMSGTLLSSSNSDQHVLNPRKRFNFLANTELMAGLDDYVQSWLYTNFKIQHCLSVLSAFRENQQRRYVRNKNIFNTVNETQPEGFGQYVEIEDTRAITVARLKKLLRTIDTDSGLPFSQVQMQELRSYLTNFYFPCLDELSGVDGGLEGGTLVSTHWTLVPQCNILNCATKGAKWNSDQNVCVLPSDGEIDAVDTLPQNYLYLVELYCAPELEEFTEEKAWPIIYYNSCVTSKLQGGDSLKMGEHLCSEGTQDYKFGLDSSGAPVVFDNYNRKKNYCLPTNETRVTGDILTLEMSGKLVLHNSNEGSAWLLFDENENIRCENILASENVQTYDAEYTLTLDSNATLIFTEDGNLDDSVVVFVGHDECRGRVFNHKDWLYYNEYICFNTFRFGIDRSGVVTMYDTSDEVGTKVHFTVPSSEHIQVIGLYFNEQNNILLYDRTRILFESNTMLDCDLCPKNITAQMNENSDGYGYFEMFGILDYDDNRIIPVLEVQLKRPTSSGTNEDDTSCITINGTMAYFDALYAGEYVCEDTLKYKFGVDDATGNVVVVNAELENTKYIYALRPSQNFDTAVLLQGSNPYIYNGKQLKESNMNNINAIDPSITNANNIEWRIHNDGFLELAEYIPQDQFWITRESTNTHLNTCMLSMDDYGGRYEDSFYEYYQIFNIDTNFCFDICDTDENGNAITDMDGNDIQVPCLEACNNSDEQEFIKVSRNQGYIKNVYLDMCVEYQDGILLYLECQNESTALSWVFTDDSIQAFVTGLGYIMEIAAVSDAIEDSTKLELVPAVPEVDSDEPDNKHLFHPLEWHVNPTDYIHPMLIRVQNNFATCITALDKTAVHDSVVKLSPCESSMPSKQRWIYDNHKKQIRSFLDLRMCLTLSPVRGNKFNAPVHLQYCHAYSHTFQEWDWNDDGRIKLHSDESVVFSSITISNLPQMLVSDISIPTDSNQIFIACEMEFGPLMVGRCVSDDPSGTISMKEVAIGTFKVESRRQECQRMCMQTKGFTGCEYRHSTVTNISNACFAHTGVLKPSEADDTFTRSWCATRYHTNIV